MSKTIPDYLRLHLEDESREEVAEAAAVADPVEIPGWIACCRRFEDATGWRIELRTHAHGERLSRGPAPISVDTPAAGGAAPWRLDCFPAGDAPPALEPARARFAASALAELLAEFRRAQWALRQREAELAACAATQCLAAAPGALGERLRAVLQGGAEAVDCQAAALYLLDDDTTALKLRAAWGLPEDRFLDPPRPLRGSLAELEALLGQAVVLEDISLLPHWRAPEEFAAGACVPVASETQPLGVLWMFSRQRRDFTAKQTGVLEIVAGRLAADLERQQRLEGNRSRQDERWWRRAAEWQAARRPPAAAGHGVWQGGHFTRAARHVGGVFCDWLPQDDERCCAALAAAEGGPIEAALTAAALHSAWRLFAGGGRLSASKLLRRLNHALWSQCAGGQEASLAHVQFESTTGVVEFAAAGEIHLGLLSDAGFEEWSAPATRLGADSDVRLTRDRRTLLARDLVVAMNAATWDALQSKCAARPGGWLGFAQAQRAHTASQFAQAVGELLAPGEEPPSADLALLAVKYLG